MVCGGDIGFPIMLCGSRFILFSSDSSCSDSALEAVLTKGLHDACLHAVCGHR